MTARQGKIIVAVTVAVMSALLLRHAFSSGQWVAFVVTETQLLVPMAISWRVLSGR